MRGAGWVKETEALWALPPTPSHLLLQLDDPGLGVAQSLVQDLNVSPVVLTRGPHCR